VPPRKTRMPPGRRLLNSPGGVRFRLRLAHAPRACSACAGSPNYCFFSSVGGAAMGAAAAGLAVVFFFTAGFFFIASRRAAGS